jgi:DNA polymerase-3 subunit alpha
MAFVVLEDIQGTCDVVVFPRVWKATKHLWQPERILVVSGKIDAGRRDEPSLLCDQVKTPDQVVLPVEQPSPYPPHEGGDRGGMCTVRVTLVRSGEQVRDVRTLRKVHGLLVGHRGQDRFVIRLVGGTNGPVELAFPNDTTRYCPELAQELAAIVGMESVQVEEERVA